MGIPPCHPRRCPRDEGAALRGSCASRRCPACPRAVCALPFPLSLGFTRRSFPTFCSLSPFGRHPQIHARPPPPRLSERGRGTRAAPWIRPCSLPSPGDRGEPRTPPLRPLGGMRVYVRFIYSFLCPHMLPPDSPRRRGRGAAQPRTASILPAPLRFHPELLPAPDLNSSRAPCLCRTARRLEFGVRFPEGPSWSWSSPALRLPSPGSRQGAGGGTPRGAGSARLAGRHPRLGHRQRNIPEAAVLRCPEVSSWDPQNKIKRVRRVKPGTG